MNFSIGEKLKQQYKAIPNISNIVDKDFSNSPKITKLYRYIKRKVKNPIKESVIQQFYDEPEKFFSSFKNDLTNTSLYDISDNSIFAHYFNVLNLKQKSENNTDDIYEKKFPIFFKEFGKDLNIQDSCMETPLHKLAKFKNKKLFFDICIKLNDIGVLNEKLLTFQNIEGKSCYDIILEDIFEKKKKIIQNNFEPYKNFIELYPNLKNSLNDKELMIITAFLSKVIIDEQIYKEIGINETFERFNSLLNNLTDKKIFFQYIYGPSSGINQLNILFGYCINEDNFDKLFNLVLELSKIKIIKENVDVKNKIQNESDLYDQCVAQHINYVIKNMRTTKAKADLEINYGLKLLEKIIPILIENNQSEVSLRLIYEKYSKDRASFIYNNKGLLSNLLDNKNIYLNQRIDIYKKYYTQLNLDLNSFRELRKDDDFIVFYFFINNDESIKLAEKEGDLKFNKIFDDFQFVGYIYKLIYVISNNHFNNDTDTDKFIKKLTDFFTKNYSDLVHNYIDLYGLSDEKQKLLFDFIIKFESDYKKDYHDNKKSDYIYPSYFIWCSKFILTEPELLYPFLLYIKNEEEYTNNITSPTCKEIAGNLYYDRYLLFYFCKLFLILKYNFEDAFKNPEIIPFFNLNANKNYLNKNKNEITNFFNTIDDKSFKQFCLLLLENPETFLIFSYTEREDSNEQIDNKRIMINLNILRKFANNTKRLIENEKIHLNEIIFGKSIEIYDFNYLITLIKVAKKQKTSFFNCVKNNKILFLISLYLLVIYYNKFYTLENKANLDQKVLDDILEEINDFINYYNVEEMKFRGINLRYILIMTNKILNIYKERKFFKHLEFMKQKILQNKSDIDFSEIENNINKNIFAFFFYIVYGQKISKNENNDGIIEFSLDFSNYDKNIINFFFDKFLYSFSPNFKEKFYPIITIFNDFINISKTSTISADENCLFWYIYEENYNLNNFCFVMLYKYIITEYPDYNPFLLFKICEYYLKEKNNKNYFELFYAIINDKSNEKNIPKHLFLLKNEDIPKNIYNNIKQIYKGDMTNNLVFNKLLVIFLNKYLIDLNYTKNSFVFDYLDNYLETRNSDIIRSVIYNYPFFRNTSYSKPYFYKLIEQLLNQRTTIYEFLKQETIYDNNIENIMNKRVKVLEHVFKLYPKEFDPYNRYNTEWQYYIDSNWFFVLYTFLKILKEQKQNLFLLSNNNLAFVKDTVFTLSNFRKVLLYRNINFALSINGLISKEELDKKKNLFCKKFMKYFIISYQGKNLQLFLKKILIIIMRKN